eukprot:scaffold22871_cov17-Tisochrysis_lutea.AAC.2
MEQRHAPISLLTVMTLTRAVSGRMADLRRSKSTRPSFCTGRSRPNEKGGDINRPICLHWQ